MPTIRKNFEGCKTDAARVKINYKFRPGLNLSEIRFGHPKRVLQVPAQKRLFYLIPNTHVYSGKEIVGPFRDPFWAPQMDTVSDCPKTVVETDRIIGEIKPKIN